MCKQSLSMGNTNTTKRRHSQSQTMTRKLNVSVGNARRGGVTGCGCGRSVVRSEQPAESLCAPLSTYQRWCVGALGRLLLWGGVCLGPGVAVQGGGRGGRRSQCRSLVLVSCAAL